MAGGLGKSLVLQEHALSCRLDGISWEDFLGGRFCAARGYNGDLHKLIVRLRLNGRGGFWKSREICAQFCNSGERRALENYLLE